MDLERVIYGELKANPKYSDLIHKDAYRWLEKVVGFYPLFISVGVGMDAIPMTGYDCNWNIRRLKWSAEYQEKKKFPNLVLFSFEDLDGVFVDYQWWNLVLNPSHRKHLTERDMSLIFKPSWTKARWLRKARKREEVQLVTPRLNLADAERVWVRNMETRGRLEDIGFGNVEVKRISVLR